MRNIFSILGSLAIAAGTVCAAQAQARAADAQLCPVNLEYFFRVGGTYIAHLNPEEAGTYDVSLTLFSDTTAYELTASKIAGGDMYFNVPHAALIKYASMDTAGKTGAQATNCPSFIILLNSDRGGGGNELPVHLDAVERSPLPPLPCGKVLQEAAMLDGEFETQTYSSAVKAEAVIKLYVDSDGHGFAPTIVQSSGDPAVDALAIQQARSAKFRPRQFLCTPVIGQYEFRLTYDRRP